MPLRRSVVCLVLVWASVHVAEPTFGQADEGQVIHLHAHNVGEEFWFALHDNPHDRNPELTLTPGGSFTFVLDNSAHVAHNLHLGAPIDQATPLILPGERAVLEVSVPADAAGTSSYWCEPHRHLGMESPLGFGPTDVGGDASLPAPSPAWLWVVLLLGGLFLRRVR